MPFSLFDGPASRNILAETEWPSCGAATERLLPRERLPGRDASFHFSYVGMHTAGGIPGEKGVFQDIPKCMFSLLSFLSLRYQPGYLPMSYWLKP